MNSVVLIIFCFASTLAVRFSDQEHSAAESCTTSNCSPEDGCRCASSNSPLGSSQIIPQFISLTFEDAVTEDLYTTYWEPLLFNRTNPDGQRIGATFYVTHQYTSYERVNSLYNRGYEIATHSVTKTVLQDYWRAASEELLIQEFGGQKHIISKFANIPAEDIQGVRTPQLQLAGNRSIQAYKSSNLSYDSSWPTLHTNPLFPYTLDYLSTQQCTLGNECPTGSYKGFWILPIVDLVGDFGECNTLTSCKTSGTADEIAEWLVGEVEAIRQSTRVPITLLVDSSWFQVVVNSWQGFNKALNTLATYNDVYFVSQKQVVDYMKNPVPLAEFRTDVENRNAACNAVTCMLNKETDIRYMTSCIPCPIVYPWLGNPDGNA
ncbi:hypothetical protein NQ318_008819 [Aromia moschata]|uniref:Chitin deacetylase n=1 Tax=Aromia moschata TaxID=1265417 RepID=A0AAV8ZAM2_9CUCU|nr:hypothetical protein NQ318_008819 [Aromia moschata]